MELFYLHPMYKDFVFIYFKNLSIFIYLLYETSDDGYAVNCGA